MISDEMRARIRRLFFAEHWKVGTITAELDVHRDTVERAIESSDFVNTRYRERALLLDPYKAFIDVTLEQHPRLRSTRLLEMIVVRGYAGSIWPVRRYVARVRPVAKHEAFFRLSTLPGEQAQCDWGHFGTITIGNATRKLSCFAMVLSWSRAIFARFVLDQTMESFLRCHEQAFVFFGGTPRSVLYDNLKSVVLERTADVIRFNPLLLSFAGHYHFAPVPVAVARGNEKGRVERAIRYLRDSFFAARRFHCVEDLNSQLAVWNENISFARTFLQGDAVLSVRDALDQERARLLPLPAHAFASDHVRTIASGKTPYVRFDKNDYSIPHTLVRKPLTLVASETTVRIVDGDIEVAKHARSWQQRKQIEDPSHFDALADDKRRAREHRGKNRLFAACSNAHLFMQSVALHGGHLGGTTSRLLRLLEQYGAQDLDAAIALAHARNAFTAASVAHVLEQSRRRQGRTVAPPVVLPSDPRVRNLVVPVRPLSSYDVLALENNERSHD